jgi:predicted dinucleotide-binding enzyme
VDHIPQLKIGILGAGHIGGTLGRDWAKAGHEVFFSSRHPDELQDLVKESGKGAQRGTLEEAVRFGDVAVLTIPWRKKEDLARPELFKGKVVVDAMNPYSALLLGHGPSFRPMDLGATTSSEETAKLLAGARLVKAFNTMAYADLQAGAFKSGKDRWAIFVAGDDPEAKLIASGLAEDIGFVPVDTGSLREGGRLQKPGSPIYTKRFTEEQARTVLQSLKASAELPSI